MNAYRNTKVSTHKSQDAIRKILMANGVRGVQFGEDFETREVQLRFAKEVGGTMRTVRVSMKIPEPPKPKRARRRSYRFRMGRIIYDKTPIEKQEQMAQATYRALHYWIKSQFEAVEFGLLTFEDVFLSHFEWVIDGRSVTTGQMIAPYLQRPQLEAPDLGDIIGEVEEDAQ